MDSINETRIINEVLNILNDKYISHKYFNDGTVSKVILLNNKYLIKQNKNLEAEIEFFKYNKLNMFQKVLYIHPDLEYVVYSFLDGEIMYDVDDPKDALNKIIDITSKYSLSDKEGYGYYLEKVDKWTDFLKSEIEDSEKHLTDYIKDNTFVYDCLNKLKEYSFAKKVIHGDFGTHNFIKRNGKMVGVIDPDTVLGDALYDTLFAIVSNVDILQTITYEDLCSLINEDKNKIYCMLVIVLYSRIARCLKYHKEDIDIYMNYYNDLIKK